MEEMGLNVFTAALAINSGLAVYQVATTGPIGSCESHLRSSACSLSSSPGGWGVTPSS